MTAESDLTSKEQASLRLAEDLAEVLVALRHGMTSLAGSAKLHAMVRGVRHGVQLDEGHRRLMAEITDLERSVGEEAVSDLHGGNDAASDTKVLSSEERGSGRLKAELDHVIAQLEHGMTSLSMSTKLYALARAAKLGVKLDEEHLRQAARIDELERSMRGDPHAEVESETSPAPGR